VVGLGLWLADAIATIVVATVIAVSAIGLFRDNLSFLLGRSPGPEYLARVEAEARSVEGVLGVHDLRAEYIGPDTVHAGMHLEVKPDLPIAEAEGLLNRYADGSTPILTRVTASFMSSLQSRQ
jgi:divalent metal cation (Fe/Co/Zn/Cd) transporter